MMLTTTTAVMMNFYDDDVYGHVGSRCLVLDHDFRDKLLLCPPTSLLTIFTRLSFVVIQLFCVLQSKS